MRGAPRLGLAVLLGLLAAGAGAEERARGPGGPSPARFRLRLEAVTDVVPPLEERRPLELEPRAGPGDDPERPLAESERPLPDFVVEGQRLRRVLEARLVARADARGALSLGFEDPRLVATFGVQELYPVGADLLDRVRLKLLPGGTEPAGLEEPESLDAGDWGAIEDLVEALRACLPLAFPAGPARDPVAPARPRESRRTLLLALQGASGLAVEARGQIRWLPADGARAASTQGPACERLAETLRFDHQGLLGGAAELVQVTAQGGVESAVCLDARGWPVLAEVALEMHVRQRRSPGEDEPAVISECRQTFRLRLERI